MYIQKKIPIENKNEFCNKAYELLSIMYELVHLKLDTRNTREGYDVCYDVVLQDGRNERLPEKLSVSEFLQFIRKHNPKSILRVVTNNEDGFLHDWDGYKEKKCIFYSEDPEVNLTISPSSKILEMFRKPPYHFVNLEITGEVDSQVEERIQSMIDKLEYPNGSDKSKQVKKRSRTIKIKIVR